MKYAEGVEKRKSTQGAFSFSTVNNKKKELTTRFARARSSQRGRNFFRGRETTPAEKESRMTNEIIKQCPKGRVIYICRYLAADVKRN